MTQPAPVAAYCWDHETYYLEAACVACTQGIPALPRPHAAAATREEATRCTCPAWACIEPGSVGCYFGDPRPPATRHRGRPHDPQQARSRPRSRRSAPQHTTGASMTDNDHTPDGPTILHLLNQWRETWPARPTTEDTIVLNPGQVAASLDLRANSSLESCTTVDGDANGRVFIVRNWPSLSRGEELLWRVTAWMNGHAPHPDLDALRAHLDEDNLRAAMTAVAA